MWTLVYEFGAYLVIAALFVVPFAKKHALALTGLGFVAITCLSIGVGAGIHALPMSALLGSYFAAGAFLQCARPFIPLNQIGVAVSVAALVLLWIILPSAPLTLAALPLAYSLLGVGSRLPIRTFSVNDGSYGMYIYAFPMQQLIASVTDTHSPWVMAVLAFVLTGLCATGSWFLIEKPALGLARLVPTHSTWGRRG